MSLPFRQQRRIRCVRRTLSDSAPQLASMLAMFTRLYAGEELPAQERTKRWMPRLVRALARAAWVVICLCGRAMRACVRLLSPCVRLLSRCVRLLSPCGQFLRRAAVRCLVACSFLPAGFRLTAGAWLVAHGRIASVPPTAHRRSR